jgi:hypothetical protein
LPNELRNTELVLYFGARQFISNERFFDDLRSAFPDSLLVGCSTGTAISRESLSDDKLSLTGVSFDKTKVRLASVELNELSSEEAGVKVAEQLDSADLKGVIVFSDGLNVNGSELIHGLQNIIDPSIPIGGGMAADGAAFEETLVGANAAPKSNVVAALGLYGDGINVRLGVAHGWDDFGPLRKVTKSIGNVLYELDGRPALDLYERYLGEEAEQLPSSGLLYPLMIQDPENPNNEVVRTILAVDRDARSMTFAGDIPEGWTCRLMRGVFDNLSNGAKDAATKAAGSPGDTQSLALLVSCVGRRLLMGQYTADEVEATAQALGVNCIQTGFYSYGEFATSGAENHYGLHNQTMTVLTLSEA